MRNISKRINADKNGLFQDAEIKTNESGLVHCDDGPAIIFKRQYQTIFWYCQNDEIHRVEGPAVIVKRKDGVIDRKTYWYCGTFFENKEGWFNAMNAKDKLISMWHMADD